MNHLYWEVVCKTAGCDAHQRVSHVDHYVPDEVLSLPWMTINVRCDACRKTHSYTTKDMRPCFTHEAPTEEFAALF